MVIPFKWAIWSMLSAVYSELCENEYSVGKGCDVTYGNSLEALYDIRTITECSQRCGRNARCLTFKFDLGGKVCELNSGRFMSLDTSCSTLLRFAMLTRSSCRKLINDDCTVDAECSVTNSGCVTNKCQCKPGYSYKYSDESCVTSCDIYGNTFTMHHGHKLKGNNNLKSTGISSIEECEITCAAQTEFICRSFNFWRWDDVQGCILSSETAMTAPTDYVVQLNQDYYNRNCQ